MARSLLIALIACLTQGCFVFEELEKGEAVMEAHRPKNLDDAGAPPEPAPETEPGLFASLTEKLQGLQDWWATDSEAGGPQRDPADVPVRCEIDGRMQYTRKSDCKLRGGRIL